MADKLEKLVLQRQKVAGKLFLARCCLALVPLVLLHLFEGRGASVSLVVFYMVGIPLLLWGYDRITR